MSQDGGRRISIGIKTSPQAVDWPTLDAAWAQIGRHDVFDSAWLNDHLTDVNLARAGASWEALTAIAALIHNVPGKWVGHAVQSLSFRHPSVVAKSAAVLDHATGGRFILGLGAGWFEPEHTPFGIPFAAMPERFDRFESGVRVIRALGSAAATTEAGVTRPDPYFPLAGATNDPPPLTPGGPQIWLGGQKRRGIALAAEVAQGWLLPAVTPDKSPTDLAYFAGRRDALLAALAAIGRDPATFDFAAQIPTGATPESRRVALDAGFEAGRLGATHIIFGMPPRLGAGGVDQVARDVAEPLRAGLGG
ncbi:MAG TPA: LLM class flavin-dependent oxidoreductase [Candidatus Limnocylindrales bacterium]|nr:LLM class flavin-dependent oxidoreductase [Candidatus Limnocylindrales bacterium]